jgi:hypothetical protein
MADPHEGRGNNEATSGRKEKDKEGDEEIERFSSGGRVAASSSSSHPRGKLKQLPTPLLERGSIVNRMRASGPSVFIKNRCSQRIPSVTVTVVAALRPAVMFDTRNIPPISLVVVPATCSCYW